MKTFSFESELQPTFFETPCILGIDEAGRGPVLGPMVYAAFFMPLDNEKKLAKLQVDDSKVLTEEYRSKKFEELKSLPSLFAYAYTALSPQDLSKWMLRRKKYNLNSIAHDTTISLISKVLAKGVKIQSIFIDTVGPPSTYEKKLRTEFPQVPNITVAAKADSLFPIVSAASIVAKVVRDDLLSTWEFPVQVRSRYSNKDWGSGYPSDPKTISWLSRTLDPVFGWHEIVRFSWSTAYQLLDKKVLVDYWPEERTMLQQATTYQRTNLKRSFKQREDDEDEKDPTEHGTLLLKEIKKRNFRETLGIQPLKSTKLTKLFSLE